MNPFIIAGDANGNSSFSIPFSTHINVQSLAAGVAETVTIPANAAFVMFSSTENFYARINATATIATDDITNGTGSELNPTIRSLIGVTSLSLIAPVGCLVTMSFYK